MAYRELTPQFLKLRAYYVKPQHTSLSPGEDSDDVDVDELTYMNKQKDLENPSLPAYTLVASLEQLHKEHCTPRFGKDSVSEEHQIEILTEEIKRLFQDSKKSIETIEVPEQLTSQDDLMKKNSKMSLVIELNDLSKIFRTGQRDYLQKLKALKSRRKELTPIEDADDLEPEERQRIEQLEQKMYDPGFTEEQVRELIENEKDILRRDKEIREILRSIVELQELFKEFGELVIQQGTLLDRIDYNIEQTHIHVKQANQALQETEQIQKYSRVTICMILLLVALVGVVAIVGIRLMLRFTVGRLLRF